MISKEELQELKDELQELKSSKQSFETQWKEIAKYIGLAYGSWPKTDGGNISAPDYKLTDVTASVASDTLANGVEGYACSSSLQWFDYAPEKLKEDADDKAAKSILEKAKTVAYKWLQKSNYYPVFRAVVRSGCDLGTGGYYFAMDRKRGIPKFKALHLADIWPKPDEYGDLTTLYRRINLTRKEAIKIFGEDNLPEELIKSNEQRKKYTFYQYLAPVENSDLEVKGDGDYLSIYWCDLDDNRTCKEERLDVKPFAIFRWEEMVVGGEWGVDSPGQLSLPAMSFVNILMEDMIQLSELVAKGHWKKTKGLKVNFRAGGVTELENGQDFAFQQATGDLSWLAEHINYYRGVINECYKTNLFLTLTMNIDRTKTATEVAGLTQERETLMQSFWSRLSNQLFEPLHEWLFREIMVSGQIEDITQEELEALKDMEWKIDYVSPAYMAQSRSFELGPTLQWLSDILQLSQFFPTVLDKINIDALVNLDHSVRNAKNEVLISDDDARKAREIRARIEAQANQTALQQEALGNVADAYQKLGKAPEAGSLAETVTVQSKESA